MRFAGLTVDEAERLVAEIRGGRLQPPASGGAGADALIDSLLVRIELPAILSDGAGPHLLASDGRLTLALGPHPGIDGVRVAMGEPRPGHVVGLVAPESTDPRGFIWRWICWREVSPADRVDALSEIDALRSVDDAVAWGLQGPGGDTR